MAPLEQERSSRPLSSDQSDEETRNEGTRESSEGPAWYYEIEEDEDQPEEDEDEDYEDQPDEEDEEDEDDEDDDDDDAIEGGGGAQRLLNIVRSNSPHPLIPQYITDIVVT
jgi:WD repeat-containing protein 23